MALKCGHAVRFHSMVQTPCQPQRRGLLAVAHIPYTTSNLSPLPGENLLDFLNSTIRMQDIYYLLRLP